MGFEQIETFLSSHIEGFFNKRLGSHVELIELIAALEKKIQETVASRGVPAPRYLFSLSKEDYHRLCAKSVLAELRIAAERQIILLDTSLAGFLSIRMQEGKNLTKGMYSLSLDDENNNNTSDFSNTLVLKRPIYKQATTSLEEPQVKLAAFRVEAGPDRGAYYEIGENKMTIGRRENNDFILTDTNVSRLHAWVSYKHYRHELYDNNSTNGTFLNGEQVKYAQLCEGDSVRIGETVFRYEVI